MCPVTRRALALRNRLRSVSLFDLAFPFAATLLVLLTALAVQTPLRDAATHGDMTGVRLEMSTAYVVVAPFCALLDMQSLLTVPQHIALVATLLLSFVLWRAYKHVRGSNYPLWRQEIGGLILIVLLPAVLVVINVLLPRPMAKLVIADAETIAVDVHAHTASSHDARRDWTQARVREWHAQSGFHVAYITDHKRFGGAIDAVAANPARSGDGVVLLSGLELRSGGQHVNVLSMTQAESVYIVNGDHLTKGLKLAGGREPLIVQTIPFKIPRFAGPGQDSLPRTNALELNDGAPKGLTMGIVRHAELLRLADSLNLALVAGSDNHGWGNVASGWTLVRVPGWRALSPGALAVRLEDTMRGGRKSTQVVERRTPLLVSAPQVALTVPVMLISAARALTPIERTSWIGWAWSTLLLRLGIRRAAHLSLARARLARRRRRSRLRVVPISAATGVQS